LTIGSNSTPFSILVSLDGSMFFRRWRWHLCLYRSPCLGVATSEPLSTGAEGCHGRMREHMRTMPQWSMNINNFECTHIQVLFKCYTYDSTETKISTLPQPAQWNPTGDRTVAGIHQWCPRLSVALAGSLADGLQRCQQVWQIAPSVAVVVPQLWI
jgi:hypothetical protein